MRRSAEVIILSGLCLFSLGTRCRPRSAPASQPADPAATNAEVPAGLREKLDAAGWRERAGLNLALWVSVARQKLYGIQDGRVLFAYPCSTALRGAGSREGSYQTPLGWHYIQERIGDGLPVGAVFKDRKFTGKVWVPDAPTTQDLILSRILWLRGLEPGLNAGKGVDSHDRYIYIHGTPGESKLGTPASLGCVRLSNAAVMELFDRCPAGTLVLITEW
jgi:L,D-transpeptidase YbiS